MLLECKVHTVKELLARIPGQIRSHGQIDDGFASVARLEGRHPIVVLFRDVRVHPLGVVAVDEEVQRIEPLEGIDNRLRRSASGFAFAGHLPKDCCALANQVECL